MRAIRWLLAFFGLAIWRDVSDAFDAAHAAEARATLLKARVSSLREALEVTNARIHACTAPGCICKRVLENDDEAHP